VEVLELLNGRRKGDLYPMKQAKPEHLYDDGMVLARSPRTGETPEQILDRLAKELNCEPRQVCDRVIAMLKERKNGKT
jgi:hypothetical protein